MDNLEHFDDWNAQHALDDFVRTPQAYVQSSIPDQPEIDFTPLIFPPPPETEAPNQRRPAISEGFRLKNKDRWTIQCRLYVDNNLPEEYVARLRLLEEELMALNPRFSERDVDFLKEAESLLQESADLLEDL